MLVSRPFFGFFSWIRLITKDEILDSVLLSTELLRREQSLNICVVWSFGPFWGPVWSPEMPKNQQKMCSFRDHMLEVFFGSF